MDLFHRYLLDGSMPAVRCPYSQRMVPVDSVRVIQSDILHLHCFNACSAGRGKTPLAKRTSACPNASVYEHGIKQYAPRDYCLTIGEVKGFAPAENEFRNLSGPMLHYRCLTSRLRLRRYAPTGIGTISDCSILTLDH